MRAGAKLTVHSAHQERPQGSSGVAPKPRKSVFADGVAARERYLPRRMGSERRVKAVSSPVACDRMPWLISYGFNQRVSRIMQWPDGGRLACAVAEGSASARKVRGQHLWACNYLAVIQVRSPTKGFRATWTNRKKCEGPKSVEF